MNYEKLGKVILCVALIFFIVFTLIFILNTTSLNSGPIASSIWGQYGDLIGGLIGTVVALVGVFLLYETLGQQRLALRRQEDFFIKQQVETRFFELVRIQRENVSELKSKGKVGREIFIRFRDDFHDLFQKVLEKYPQNASPDKKENESVPKWYKEITQVAYLILFYGVNNFSMPELKRKIQAIAKDRGGYYEIESLLDELEKEHKAVKEKNKEKGSVKKYLHYDGQQSRLGHYFRHLFQTVKYINDQPPGLFSYQEKYNYLKTLRAQLSTHEQAILFFNSLTELGAPWEMGLSDENYKLITKYNLIKNLPSGFTNQIDPKFYYPDVHFEYDEKPSQNRIKLESSYR